MWEVFSILTIVWFAWRMGKDITNDDTPFSVMVLHLMLFYQFFCGVDINRIRGDRK